MKPKLSQIGILIAGIVFALPAFASTSAHLPPEHRAGSVSYMSGGIGSQEAAAMKAAERRFSLAMEFARRATPKNEYLADISVIVKDKSGKAVLDTRSTGPFLLADMPAGKYTVIARYEGRKVMRTAEVKADHHERLVFLWPESAPKM